ncbi:hypothetical protein L218DRAFT_796791, partial [Marasmius fiardii PR-910]
IDKRELMHYTRRKRDKNCSPAIIFDQEADGVQHTVAPTSYIRWLGMFFDRKLRFDKHAKLMAVSCDGAVSGLTMLANTIWGLHQTKMRQLYIVCVQPKFLYAVASWWNGCGYQVKPLEKMQHR